jgi:hypothetical protein
MVDPEVMIQQFNQYVRQTLMDRVREAISEKDSTINWTQVRIVSTNDPNKFCFETKDTLTDATIRRAYGLIEPTTLKL